MMGVRPEQLAKLAADEGADVVGANCGRISQEADFLLLIERMKSAASLPLMLQPNAGQPEMQGSDIVYHCSPDELAGRMAQIAKQVRIIGGCCGSTPAHIRAMKERFNPATPSLGE